MDKAIGRTIKILVILLLVGWVAIVFVDYFRNVDGKDPIFCLKKETKKYSDGKVYICTGLGYKAIRYDRKTMGGNEFGPFFIKDRTEPKN